MHLILGLQVGALFCKVLETLRCGTDLEDESNQGLH